MIRGRLGLSASSPILAMGVNFASGHYASNMFGGRTEGYGESLSARASPKPSHNQTHTQNMHAHTYILAQQSHSLTSHTYGAHMNTLH